MKYKKNNIIKKMAIYLQNKKKHLENFKLGTFKETL